MVVYLHVRNCKLKMIRQSKTYTVGTTHSGSVCARTLDNNSLGNIMRRTESSLQAFSQNSGNETGQLKRIESKSFVRKKQVELHQVMYCDLSNVHIIA